MRGSKCEHQYCTYCSRSLNVTYLVIMTLHTINTARRSVGGTWKELSLGRMTGDKKYLARTIIVSRGGERLKVEMRLEILDFPTVQVQD